MLSDIEKLINNLVDRATGGNNPYTPRPVQPTYGQPRPVQQPSPVPQTRPVYQPKPEFRPVPEYFKEDAPVGESPAKAPVTPPAKKAVKPIVGESESGNVSLRIDPKQAAQAVVWTEILGQRRGITLRENRRRRMAAMIPPQSEE